MVDPDLSDPPLAGREIEVSALTAILDGAAAGRGGVVLILGAPGTGKTRLLGVARQLATARGMAVRTARGSEREFDEPYGVARQLVGPCLRRRGYGISEELCWRVADLVLPQARRPTPRGTARRPRRQRRRAPKFRVATLTLADALRRDADWRQLQRNRGQAC